MKRKLKGVVTSDRMNKTIVVTVERKKTHPLYRKKFSVHKKFMAENTIGAKEGDFVIIEETKPISKMKRWVATKVITEKELEE